MDLPPSYGGAPSVPPETLPTPIREAASALDGDAAYLYDPDALRERAVRLRAALPDWAMVFYAVKANSFPPLVRGLAAVVDGFEVASAAEIALVDGARVAVSGPGKTRSLLRRAVSAPRAVVNAESELELHRLADLADAAGRTVPVALRVRPERVPLTGSLSMRAPFGIPEAGVPAAVELARKLPGLDLIGFHVHAVSGNLDASAHVAYVRWCLEWSSRTAARTGFELRRVDVGGGLGVPFENEDEFDLDVFGEGLRGLRPPAGVRVVIEPGRWLAAPIGWYAAEVTDVKGGYAVVRGGINHFQLPTSWEIRHNFAVLPRDDWPPSWPRPEASGPVTVSGELCTPEDVLARDVSVPAIRAGDVVVFPNAGAYGFEFAMPAFLGHPPARRVSLPTSPLPTSPRDHGTVQIPPVSERFHDHGRRCDD